MADTHPCKRFKRSCLQCKSMCQVATHYHLVKQILSYLSAKELIEGPVHVSRVWNEICVDLLKKRQKQRTLFNIILNSEKTFGAGGDGGTPYLALVKDFLHQCYFYPSKMFILTSSKMDPSLKYMKDHMKKVAWYQHVQSFCSAHQTMTLFIKLELAPPTCDIYCVSSYSIFGIHNTNNQTHISEIELNDKGPAAISMLFSERLSKQMSFFSLSRSLEHSRRLTEELIKEKVRCPPHEPLQCLLYLSAQHGDFARLLLGQILTQLPHLVVAGAFIRNHSLFDANSNVSLISNDCVTGIAFYGNAITASSLVLDSDCRTDQEIDRKMAEFRKSVGDIGKDSLAILVFCVQRKNNLDIRCFKQHFPNVTAIGMSGYGEFGRNVVNGECLNLSEDYDYAFSTVITVINFSNLID